MNKPEKKFRAGPVTATIWQNEATRQDGSKAVFYTVSLERSYKNKEGEWASSNTFRVNDIPKAVLVLNKAYEYVTLKELGLPHVTEDEEVEEI